MKIGLIVPANLYFAPYVKIYTKVLDKMSIDYDIINWDRDGIEDSGVISFFHKTSKEDGKLKKLFNYCRFSLFVIKKIKHNKYSKLIVFTPQLSIFLYLFLKKHYKKAFVLDYRDLSIEQKSMFVFNKVLKISGLIVVSSPGFKKYLPSGYDYILSHNFDIDNLLNMESSVKDQISNPFNGNEIIISTIGGIRDYIQNKEIITTFQNDLRFNLNFIGRGPSAESLKTFSKENIIKNVFFVGFYKKEEESKYIFQSDFLNIYYPSIKSHSSALSNRFYNALIYKRPMIVTTHSVQGDYVEKYELGLAIDNCAELKEKIIEYKEKFNYDQLVDKSNILLDEFKNDYYVFEQKIKEFMNKTLN